MERMTNATVQTEAKQTPPNHNKTQITPDDQLKWSFQSRPKDIALGRIVVEDLRPNGGPVGDLGEGGEAPLHLLPHPKPRRRRQRLEEIDRNI